MAILISCKCYTLGERSPAYVFRIRAGYVCALRIDVIVLCSNFLSHPLNFNKPVTFSHSTLTSHSCRTLQDKNVIHTPKYILNKCEAFCFCIHMPTIRHLQYCAAEVRTNYCKCGVRDVLRSCHSVDVSFLWCFLDSL